MKRRLLATFLSLCLLVGLLPTVALATDEEPGAEPASVCICEARCTEGAADKTCPVCAADYTVCAYVAPVEPVCAGLDGCVNGAHAADCPLYAEPADDTQQEQEQEEPAAQPVTSTESTPNLLNGNGASGLLSGTCGAEGNETGVTWTLKQNNSGSEPATYTLTISGTGAMKDWESGFGVYPKDAPWATSSYLSRITHVVVEDGVTYIGDFTFGNLSSMETLSLGKDVASFGIGPFAGKRSLMTITVDPENTALKVIDGALLSADGTTLYACTNDKESYCVPDGVTTIYRCAFSGNDNLKTIDLNQVTNIDTYAFLDAGLTEVYVPATVTTMGAGVFRAPNIESVEFYGTNLATQTFYGCTQLKKITIGSTVQTIGMNVFNGCSSIETVYYDAANATGSKLLQNATATGVTLTIGPNVQSIYNDFLNDTTTMVDELIIGEGQPFSIGARAFKGCSNITELNDTYDRIVSIGSEAFINSGLTGTLILGNGVETIGVISFKGTSITKLIIEGSESGVSIEGAGANTNGAFASLGTLTTVVGRNIKEVGWGTFYGCSNLVAIDLSGSPNLNQPATTYYQSPFKAIANNSVIYLNNSANVLTNYHYDTSKTSIAYTNGGTFAADTQFTAGTLATPTKDGAIFAGWYTDSNFSGSPVTTAQAGQTYYAKWIELTTTEIPLQYQGTQALPTAPNGVTYSDWKSEDSSIVSIENNQLKANKVGETTITATATYNGNTAEVSVPVEVTPRVLTYTLAGEDTGSGSITYNYSGGHHALADSLTFEWADESGTEVTLVEGTDINYNYAVSSENGGDGTARTYDYLPMPVGSYDNVKFNLLNENYTFGLSDGSTRDYLEIDVEVVAEGSQRAYLASAAPKADQNFVYTGEGVLPVEGTLNAYTQDSTSSDPVEIGTFTVNIEGLNDTTFHSEVSEITAGTDLSSISGLTLPTEPGTYIITASAASKTHYLYKSLVFTISKATVTIKADDKTIYVGDDLPEWTYTVSGLASGESLSETVSLSCDAADTNTAGTYTITPSGAAVPDTDRYNDAIVYQTGTLTILSRGGGGGSSSSSGGSSSSNVSGSGDDVSISASGGTVTTSQMESAVKKADEGAAITIKATGSSKISLPASGLESAADNDNSLTLDLRYGEVTLSPEALSSVANQAGSTVTLTVAPVDTDELNSRQQAAVGDAPVFDLTIRSGSTVISDFDGGLATVSIPYELPSNQDPAGVVVWFLDDDGNITPCETMYDTRTETVIFTTRHFSKYVIGYEEPTVFTDVSEDAYYADAVLWAVTNGVTYGTSATTFSPDMAVSRAQMVTFLWRAHGSPEATGTNPFTDVSTSDYYYDAVLWAVANGVTNGTSATTFSPDMAVTRAQAVTFQWRAAGSPVVSGSSFGDVASDAYYVNAVTWAVANGITNGTSATTFSPDVVVSRAQAVTFLHRELG